MADVFISFSSRDAERVARIHDRLVEHGFDVWWMRNLLPGDSPIKTVSRELVNAKKVMLAWSRHAEVSPYIEGEIMHAFGERKLLPVRIEKWAWPAFLSSVQFVDMTPADDEAEAWRQIDARLGEPSSLAIPRIALGRLEVPRSAGPVRALAAMMTVLVVALVVVLAVAYRAIRTGDMAMLQLVRYSLAVLPVVAGGLVLVAARRVWGAWQSRPALSSR